MLKEIYRYFRNKYRLIRWRNKKVHFLYGAKIDSKCIFEGNNSIGENNLLKNCNFRFGTYTGQYVNLSSVKIGRFCSLGSNIRNTTGRHPTTKFVSTHPSFFSTGKAAGFTFTKNQLFKKIVYTSENYLVDIGNDVWIGDNVTIFDNVKIGDGAIIGANSLVTNNIEPYSINVGAPTKVIKYRFNEENRLFLSNFKWWDRDIDWIRENYIIFSDIDLFRKKFDSN